MKPNYIMNPHIATLTLKNMAAAHRQLQNNMGDAFTTTLSSFRSYLKTTALWFAKKDSDGLWVECGTCDANGTAWTAETLFASYGCNEVMKVWKNADKAVFLQNIVPVTATPAVETTTADNTAPAAELKMPFNPLQNYTMFHNQIRGFLGTDCTVEKVNVAWHEARKYRVTTVAGVVYEVVLNGDFYVFTQVETATHAVETITADNTAPANATVETAPITASARFFWNGVKIGDSKKLIKVWYSFNKSYPDRQASLMIHTKSSVGELTGLAGLQKNESDYATDLYLGDCAIITENMPEYIPALTAAETLYTRRSEKGDKLAVSALESIKNELARLAMPVIEVTPAQATAEMPAAHRIMDDEIFPHIIHIIPSRAGIDYTHEEEEEEDEATATATAEAVAMPAAAESQMTESEMSAFRDNLEKLSPKQLLVSLVEISAAKRHLESLSQGEAGESPFHKLAREVWITSDQMTLVDQYQKIGLPTRLINMPSESTEAAVIIPEVSTDKTEVMPEVEVATTEAAIIKEMLDSDITRCRIQALLYQAGLAGYRVTKRAPEQLSTKELADLSEAETNIILDKNDNEVWDAGWASWRERTMKFIDMVKAKQTVAINLNEVQVGIPGKGIARCAFAPSAKDEDREAVMMILANGISLSDVIHHRRTKYKLVADPRCFKGFGVVLAESYEGLKHRIPFIVRLGDEGWNEEALADFSKVVNL